MKLAVEFPSVAYREGPEGVARLAREIERIGFDQLDMFDHVVMGYPAPDRPRGPYPAKMPILEALTTLGFIAATTKRIGLGTEVLVLTQRQPILVAKQISTLDTLSGGRIRLGVGVGWQQSEYEALDEDFRTRGARMDDAIRLLRQCFTNENITSASKYYGAKAIAMEPKPPQGANLPIWIGGHSPRALKRVGELGDGWLGTSAMTSEQFVQAFATIRRAAEAAGRDAAKIGMQTMFDVPPRENDAAGKAFFQDMDRVARRAAQITTQGFEWAAINATAVFQSGARSVAALVDTLGRLHERIHREAD